MAVGGKDSSSWTSMRRLNMSCCDGNSFPHTPKSVRRQWQRRRGTSPPLSRPQRPAGQLLEDGWLVDRHLSLDAGPLAPGRMPRAALLPVRPLPPLSLRADLAAPPTSPYAHLAARASRPGGGGCRIGAAPGGARGSCICRSRSGTLRRWLPAYRAVGRTRKTPDSAPRAVRRSRWRRRRASARP
jgi:hypothetical protein